MSHSVPDSQIVSDFWAAVKNRSISVKALTKAEYDVLDVVQKNAGILYVVKHVDGVSFFYNETEIANSDDVPIRVLTKVEYDALSEEDKQKDIVYVVPDEKEVDDRITMDDIEEAIQNAISNLDDGVPTGAIVSFMALNAPDGYLVCDGSIYNISAYSKLAQYIATQFGSPNYFGGDGATTFAVPDMRNLFLRGYHGNATDQLSGDIGVKQEGTEIPHVATGGSSKAVGLYSMNKSGEQIDIVNYQDKIISTTTTYGVTGLTQSSVNDISGNIKTYTSRPVNMAVLFCIKT